jgi:hypothetical protein
MPNRILRCKSNKKEIGKIKTDPITVEEVEVL